METIKHNSILAVVMSRDEQYDGSPRSLLWQTVRPSHFVFADAKYSLDLPIGVRIGRAINKALKTVDLKEFDYVFKCNGYVVFQRNYLEECLKLSADLVGQAGYAQMIKVKSFLKCFGGVYPESSWAEDSALAYGFIRGGYLVARAPMRPYLPKPKKYSREEWVEAGKERFRLGIDPFHVLFSFRDYRRATRVGFNAVYVVAGYFYAVMNH